MTKLQQILLDTSLFANWDGTETLFYTNIFYSSFTELEADDWSILMKDKMSMVVWWRNMLLLKKNVGLVMTSNSLKGCSSQSHQWSKSSNSWEKRFWQGILEITWVLVWQDGVHLLWWQRSLWYATLAVHMNWVRQSTVTTQWALVRQDESNSLGEERSKIKVHGHPCWGLVVRLSPYPL